MPIVIKLEEGKRIVYKDKKLAGTLRHFCCGIDFRPIGNQKVLISIMRVRLGSKELKKCLESLLSFELPNKGMHVNFNYDTATNEEKFNNWKAIINAKYDAPIQTIQP